MMPPPTPPPETEEEQRQRELAEKLVVARDAAKFAHDTINTILQETLRFPLASSTRVDAHERND